MVSLFWDTVAASEMQIDGHGSSATFAIRLNVCVSGRLTYLVHEWVMKISPVYILKVFYSGMLQSFSQFIFTGVLFFL